MTPETDVMAERRRRIAGRVAIVTGASGGVRRGIAHRLAAAGMRVVVSSRDAGRARTVAGELSTLGAESLAVQADVTVPEAVERLVSTAVERYRPLNLMCNNAALMYVTPFFDSTIEGWQRVFQVNVGGVLLGTQLAARQMRRQAIDPDTGCRGKIVNVSSPGAEVTVPTEAAYGASKAAVNHLTRNAAALLADDLISVTALYPGNVWGARRGSSTSTRAIRPGPRQAPPRAPGWSHGQPAAGSARIRPATWSC